MTQLIRKLNYINKQTFAKSGSRSIVVTTTVECGNTGKAIVLKDMNVNVKLQRNVQEFNVQLEGIKQLFASTMDLENGLEPFKDFSILKIPINKINGDDSSINDSESSEQDSSESENEAADSIKLAKCLVTKVSSKGPFCRKKISVN